MTDPTTTALREMARAFAVTAPPSPEMPAAPSPRRPKRPFNSGLILAGAAAVTVAVGVTVALLNATPDTPQPATTSASCETSSPGLIAGQVGEVPWSIAVDGEAPDIGMQITVADEPTAGFETNSASWYSHLKFGAWEWIYDTQRINVVAGMLPLGTTARVALADGGVAELCSTDFGPRHGVGYAGGAFPESATVESVEIVDSSGRTVGMTDLATVEGLSRPTDGPGTLGFSIEVVPRIDTANVDGWIVLVFFEDDHAAPDETVVQLIENQAGATDIYPVTKEQAYQEAQAIYSGNDAMLAVLAENPDLLPARVSVRSDTEADSAAIAQYAHGLPGVAATETYFGKVGVPPQQSPPPGE